MENSTKVTANIKTGNVINRYDENGMYMYSLDQSSNFEKTYNTIQEFLKDFTPNKFSENLKNAITDVFNNGGEVTFNYVGSRKGNETFYFSK